MPILDVAVTSLVPLAALVILAALVVRARRRSAGDRVAEPSTAAETPASNRYKLGCIEIIVGIMVFGLVVQSTVLAYWRWRMPE